MANQIRKIKRMEIPESVIREQNLADVTREISENKEAILKGIDLLATLNKSGSLDAINALVKQKEAALGNLITELNKERYSASLENLSNLFEFIGEIDVDELQYFMGNLNQGMKGARKMEGNGSTSYVGLIKALKDPEINRSITMLLEFLRGMGKR